MPAVGASSGTGRRRRWLVLFRLAVAEERAAPVGASELHEVVGRAMHRLELAAKGGFGVELQRDALHLVAAFATGKGALMAVEDAQLRMRRLPPLGGQSLALRVAIMWSEEGSAERAALDMAIADALAAALPGDGVVCTRAAAALLEAIVPADVASLGEVRSAGVAMEAVRFMPLERVIGLAGKLPAERPRRLMLFLQGKRWYVDAARASLLVGRAPESDLVIPERHVSRRHAEIRRDGEGFVLADASANGTCIFAEDGSAQMIKRRSVLLPAVGWIGFGRSVSPDDPWAVRFSDDSVAGGLARAAGGDFER